MAPRKIADLLIVDADPSADIRNTRRIRYVIQDGRIVHVQEPQRCGMTRRDALRAIAHDAKLPSRSGGLGRPEGLD